MASGTKLDRQKRGDRRDTNLSVADLFTALRTTQATQDGHQQSPRGSLFPTSNIDSEPPDFQLGDSSHIFSKLLEVRNYRVGEIAKSSQVIKAEI
ncbi:Hypothetical predicted protein [Pelobates cultripes]|uniref:Uncharacterized protein n=1 Tax=Pelobates cultripes TaxID=61616 RepID=A0AAD1WRA1_PELCU|nr:Hypothetical predicted protein [Pelobates cultripes]